MNKFESSGTGVRELPDLIIRVDDYDRKKLTGAIYCPFQGIKYDIINISQLILYIDEFIHKTDSIGADRAEIFETAYHQNFGRTPRADRNIGTVFTLKICFDRYGTWQGILTCLDTRTSSFFRNAAEMLLMMDSELESGKTAWRRINEDR